MEGCIYPPPPPQFVHLRVKRQPETRVMSPFIYILGFLSNSTIIGANASYQYRLHHFLVPSVGLNPQWALCYHASTHGWAASTFHSRCDGKRDTVTIINNLVPRAFPLKVGGALISDRCLYGT